MGRLRGVAAAATARVTTTAWVGHPGGQTSGAALGIGGAVTTLRSRTRGPGSPPTRSDSPQQPLAGDAASPRATATKAAVQLQKSVSTVCRFDVTANRIQLVLHTRAGRTAGLLRDQAKASSPQDRRVVAMRLRGYDKIVTIVGALPVDNTIQCQSGGPTSLQRHSTADTTAHT